MPKYIFVTGGVVSSLGKGLASASIGCLLEGHGYTVAMSAACFLSGILFTFMGRALRDEVDDATRATGLLTLANTTGAMVTEARGGHGAFREFVEAILRARGEWDALVAASGA